MKRGISPAELESIIFEDFDFEGEWFDAFDKPETNGIWFIWGNSSNGKTSFILKLIKYLTTFDVKAIYDSLEEGRRKSMQKAFREANMKEVTGKVIMVQEPIEELKVRLKKRDSAKVVVIDSIQYAMLSFQQFLSLKREFPKKLFIIISQAEGRKPKGRMANDVMYDADLKIWVEGHRAISKGRYIGKKGYYTNWIEGAARYWGQEPI
ncbi:hypothetical protein [Pedobacter sp. WC2423]|uniref:hypothetical protein n=1 Tax=Pedobacter sp. WC2423 TaxID=3234142 RepID=UPI003467A0D7